MRRSTRESPPRRLAAARCGRSKRCWGLRRHARPPRLGSGHREANRPASEAHAKRRGVSATLSTWALFLFAAVTRDDRSQTRRPQVPPALPSWGPGAQPLAHVKSLRPALRPRTFRKCALAPAAGEDYARLNACGKRQTCALPSAAVIARGVSRGDAPVQKAHDAGLFTRGDECEAATWPSVDGERARPGDQKRTAKMNRADDSARGTTPRIATGRAARRSRVA